MDTAIKDKVLGMINQIQQFLADGMTLQQITAKTYAMRESGQDMLYFGWAVKSKDPDEACIMPLPTKKSPYWDFFNRKGEGFHALPEVSLYIYQHKVEFTLRKKVDGNVVKDSLL